MTKKLLMPLDDPPTASLSDEEVESSGEDEELSSSEEEEPTDPVKSTSAAVTIAVPGKTAAGSETETDSDSEAELASNPPNPGSGKASTAIDSKSKKKKVPVALALPASKPEKKRPIEANSSDAKRVKIDDEKKKTGEESKKPAFQRLWTEEDEITVLQGMIDFKADTGKSPYEDSNGYYDFIKKSISFDVSKNQFMDKIRSLKKKYISKEKTSFSKPHDLKSLNLAKYIWGPEGMALESVLRSNGVSKKTPKTKKLDSVKQELHFASPNVEEEGDLEKPQDVKKSDWFEKSFLVTSIASFGVDEEYVKQRWSLVEVENKKKVEDKYKELQAKEYEYVLQKTKLLHEVTSMIGEASKNKSLGI